MSLSSKTKNNRKNSNKQDQRGSFCRETRCVSKQDQMDKPTHLVHHFSISLASLCQSLISLLSHSSLLPTTHFRFIIFVFHLAFLGNEHRVSGFDLDCRTMLDRQWVRLEQRDRPIGIGLSSCFDLIFMKKCKIFE